MKLMHEIDAFCMKLMQSCERLLEKKGESPALAALVPFMRSYLFSFYGADDAELPEAAFCFKQTEPHFAPKWV